MKILFNYFLRGLIFIFPVFSTLYIILILVQWANNLFNQLLFNWLPVYIPGLGLLIAILLIVFLGFLVSRVVTQPFFNFLERILGRTPLIKIIYTAIRDLTEAFVGDKKKFNKPILVSFAEGIDRIGFVTDGSLERLEIYNRITVYCPHSYNFSGNLFLVDPAKIRPLNVNPADAMKFTVSAGITHIELGSTLQDQKGENSI